jgi:hypothetical protein
MAWMGLPRRADRSFSGSLLQSLPSFGPVCWDLETDNALLHGAKIRKQMFPGLCRSRPHFVAWTSVLSPPIF